MPKVTLFSYFYAPLFLVRTILKPMRQAEHL